MVAAKTCSCSMAICFIIWKDIISVIDNSEYTARLCMYICRKCKNEQSCVSKELYWKESVYI